MIRVKDNSACFIPSDENHENLRWLAKHPIRQLCAEEGGNLLVFPQSLDEYGDKIGDQFVFAIEGVDKIRTGNIMGFVGYKDTEISICSRFVHDKGDYFLHYMLQKVFAINLFDLKHDFDRESIFDFLVYLFPAFLKRALRQGLYKEYQTRKYNDANIRGRIDVQRHIRLNNPFGGKIAYTTREYSVDNNVTQLVRHTIEYIASYPFAGNVLNNDEETKEAVGLINRATPSYNRNDRGRVISQNLKPLNHPYFVDYGNLQRLCLQILRHDEIKYGDNKEQVYGVLFDGAWLWEEYLNTFLSGLFKHPRNKTEQGRKYLFEDGTGWCYPDFHNNRIVLDAKYKGYEDWSKVQNADLYQVISYMHVLRLDRGGFVVPIAHSGKQLHAKTLKGIGGRVSVFGMKVDHDSLIFNDYVAEMKKEEARLLDSVNVV